MRSLRPRSAGSQRRAAPARQSAGDAARPSLVAAPPADVAGQDQAHDKDSEEAHRLVQRQKQIDYGKNTIGYQNYIAAVPKERRERFTHPSTPDVNTPIGKRQWDGLVRRRLSRPWSPLACWRAAASPARVHVPPPCSTQRPPPVTAGEGLAPEAARLGHQ